MRKVLVLGSNSFAGSNFVRLCLDKDCEVVGLSRSSEAPLVLNAYADHPKRDRFRFFQCDINKDLDQLFSVSNEFQPEIVVDFAGQGMVAPSWQNPEQWYQTNIIAKVRWHEFLRKQAWLKRYMRVSTPEVYGSTGGAVDESARLAPSTPYAVSHAAVDWSLLAYFKQYRFPVILTRSANFYGPRQHLYRIVPRTMIYARLGKKLPLHGGGHSERAFLYGEDFAQASWTILEKGEVGETYHISTPELVSIRGLVEKICEMLRVEFSELAEVTEDRPGKDQAYILRTEKLAALGWQPKVNLKEGLSRVLTWVDEDLEHIKNMELDYVHKE